MMTVTGPILPVLWNQLPIGGWRVGFSVDIRGRTLVDVEDSSGSQVYSIASTRRAAPSVDAAWAGHVQGPEGEIHRWALAIGHVSTGAGHMVAFACPAREAGRDRAAMPHGHPSRSWKVGAGLWVAAAIGSYTHVWLTARSATLLHSLQPVAA